jgi:tRNA A37 threonylcarbamoyladenosine modification protein TsaB
MILFLDTSDYEEVRIALISKQVSWHKFNSRDLSEELLVEIKKFLQKLRQRRIRRSKVNKVGGKNSSEFSELTKIAVVVGPGGFSRVRTAVSTANALGFGLNIRVIGLNKDKVPNDLLELVDFKSQKMTTPIYGSAPKITMKKK